MTSPNQPQSEQTRYETPQQPAPRRRRWRVLVTAPWRGRIISALVGAFLVGVAWSTTALVGTVSGPDTFTMDGAMLLNSYDDVSSTTDGGCTGTGGYSDISEGTTLTVYDAEENVLAVGRLGQSTSSGSGCLFYFTVDDVPKEQKFYRVEVAHRGKVTFSAEQATSGDIEMSLGD